MFAPALCSVLPARQSILSAPTLCIPLGFTAHDSAAQRTAAERQAQRLLLSRAGVFPLQLSLTLPAAAKKENSADFSKGIFPPALRLVAGRPPGNVTHAVFPLHLPTVGDLHFQA